MSLPETLQHLCELEPTQIFTSLTVTVLKLPCAGYPISCNRSNFVDYETSFGNTNALKKFHHIFLRY